MNKINPFYKSPPTLGKAVFASQVLALENKPIKLDSFQVLAQRKDKSGSELLTCNPILTIERTPNPALLEIRSYLPFFDQQQIKQGHRQLKTTFRNSTATDSVNLVFMENDGMASEGSFKLGKLIHGMTSCLFKEAEQIWKTPIPFGLQSDYAALPFHLIHCGGNITKFINIIDLYKDYYHTKQADLDEARLIFGRDSQIKKKMASLANRKASEANLDSLKKLLLPHPHPEASYAARNYIVFLEPARKTLEDLFQRALISH